MMKFGEPRVEGVKHLWLGCWTGQRGHNIPLDAAARGHGGRQEGSDPWAIVLKKCGE